MFKLEVLDNYYRKNRQVGHTVALLNGAKSDKNILVVIAHESQKSYIDLPKEQMINMEHLNEKLKGRISPVLVDHFTMQLMYHEMKKELDKNHEIILELKMKNKILREREKVIRSEIS